MPKIYYEDLIFDSQLEVDYYKYLVELVNKEELEDFIYHPCSIQLTNIDSYTPDFILFYKDKIEIIETKGYNQFSYLRDKIVDSLMKNKTYNELADYVRTNFSSYINLQNFKNIKYRKIKYMSKFGWVDFSFKNPNTIANKRKIKIEDLEKENKQLKKELKDYHKFYKLINKEKLNSKENIWLQEFKQAKEIE